MKDKDELLTAYIVGVAETMLEWIINTFSREIVSWPTDRKGVYLCLADSSGFPLVISAIGEVPEDKRQRYFDLCQEKALRLANNANHLSSYQTRNPEKDLWGGAIRCQEEGLIISCSGLPELADESLVMAIARDFFEAEGGLPEHPDIIALEKELERNPYWEVFTGRDDPAE